MGKAKKAFMEFVDEIPGSKLTGLSTKPRTLHKDANFRLDMQRMTTGPQQSHNLQIQVNNGTKITSLKPLARKTISTVIAPTDPEMSASALRRAFKESFSG